MCILVTGANGQLASCIKEVVENRNIEKEFLFLDKEELDITNIDNVERVFNENPINIVVNCAAYTNVDDAINNVEKAYKINEQGPINLALCAKNYDAKMIHISTDYVFNGETNKPYSPDDKPSPCGVYGASKLAGEDAIFNFDNTMIIRTSWLYSNYGRNFYKTIINRIHQNLETHVVDDQIGTPTYAMDLAEYIVDLIELNNIPHKILHYSNNGCCSWYDFAKLIELIHNSMFPNYDLIKPCSTHDYWLKYGGKKTIRPFYSVLSKTETEELNNKKINHWVESLYKCCIDGYSLKI